MDTINEHCYGVIDNVLIESTVEGYLINADYYALLQNNEK
ncbi:tellurite resistance TerB C-terminal domain-containing protein [Mucilaginibacter pineti]